MTPRNFSGRFAVTGMIAGLVAATLPALTLSPAHAAVQAAPVDRPTEDIFKGPEATPVCRGDVCVHYAQDGTNDVAVEDDGTAGAWKGYAGNGVPDYVDLISASLVPKTAKVFADAGYRAPLGDGTAGGGVQVDIYLADLDDVVGGAYCQQETGIDDTAAGWCVLDNDYTPAEYGTKLSRAANLGLDVVHQYFHLVQWAYSRFPDWLADASATWVEDEVYPTLNRNRAYLPYSLGRPERSVGVGHVHAPEGAWIFLRYLSERFPAEEGGLPVIVRRIWEQYRPEADGFDGATEALRPVLADLGTTVINEMITYSTWNRDPARYYDEGAAYKAAPLNTQVTLSPSRLTAELAGPGDERSSRTLRFRPSSSLTGSWRLQVRAWAGNTWGETEMAYVATFKAKGRTAVTRVLVRGNPVSKTATFAFGAGVEYVDIRVVFGRAFPPGLPEQTGANYEVAAKASRG